jgi:ferredoxin-type protein NapH
LKKIKEARNRKNIQMLLVPLVPVIIIGGLFWPYLGYVAISMMLLMMITAVFRGRYYCGWICAMGAFHERVLSLVSRRKKMLPLFKAEWFKWLIFVLMMGLLAMRLFFSGGEPAEVGAVFVMMWAVSTGFAIFFGFGWKPRSWCSVCPMATFQGFFPARKFVLRVDESCKQCGLCQKVCPIETYPGSFKEAGVVNGNLCMRCGNCVENCPVNALSFGPAPAAGCATCTTSEQMPGEACEIVHSCPSAESGTRKAA